MAPRNAPLYTQPADWVREQIRSGELPPGSEVPTERDLADQFGVSRATAARALDLLVTEGLISPGQSRAGRQVRHAELLAIYASRSESMDHRTTAGVDAWVSDTTSAGRSPGQTIEISVVHAPDWIAEWLEVEPMASVAVRRRLRTLDGQISNTADTYYPMWVTTEVPEILDPSDIPQGALALMAERGLRTESYVDALRWRTPTPEEARTLEISQGVSILAQVRTGYTDSKPIHLTRTLWPGDTIELRYEVPA